MPGFGLGKVFLGPALPDSEVGVLGEEGEVGHRVDLAEAVSGVVEHRLGKQVVHLQAGEVTEQVTVQRQAAGEVAGTACPGEHVQQRIETGTAAEAPEVVASDRQVPAAPSLEGSDETSDA